MAKSLVTNGTACERLEVQWMAEKGAQWSHGLEASLCRKGTCFLTLNLQIR